MSTWIIGDLQGCGDSFSALRDRLEWDYRRDTLILVGDIVNRGPTSLATLRWVVDHASCVQTVLGNHDIHLLWCALGDGQPHGRDTLDEILRAPDRDQLIAWLRQQPFFLDVHDGVVVHAGIHPAWSLQDARMWSSRLHARMMRDDAGPFLNAMRRKQATTPTDCEDIHAMDVFTRMRALRRLDHSLDLQYNGTLENLPPDLIPWFQVPAEHPRPQHVFFGHWAALGFHHAEPYIALDSGCVWGNGLTAWCLEDGRRIFQPAIDRFH